MINLVSANGSTSTDQFVSGLYKLSQQAFPPEVIEEAKKCLLDYLGVTLAGARMVENKSSGSLEAFDDQGDVPVIGLDRRTSINNAILFNGIHSHVAELDDGHRVAMMHPGAPVISALLPVAYTKEISGNDFLRGLVMGYEASIRIASALQPSLKEKGFHGTGIAGAIGAAVAIATAMKFSEKQIKDTVSAASTNASGILKVIKDVSELKPYNVGNAAQNGYVAAMLAYSGFGGPYDTFGGDLGFLSMFSDDVKADFLKFGEADGSAISKIYRKPYAACRHCHSPIEATLILKARHGLSVGDIKAIHVRTYGLGVAGHEHTTIVGINSAKMSTPYSVAVALMKSKAGLAEFSDKVIGNPELLALTKKVEIQVDDELSLLVPDKRAAIVTIETKNGQMYSYRVDHPKGEPENPITTAELEEKFVSLAQFAGKSKETCQDIINVIDNIDTKFHRLFEHL